MIGYPNIWENSMDRSNGTDHETALRMALGVLADSMESKLEPYTIALTDGPPEGYDLCATLNGKYLDVCHDLRDNTWHCTWDGDQVGSGFATRDEAKQLLIDYIRSFGIEVPDDILDGD
jgi:hypothetical protein